MVILSTDGFSPTAVGVGFTPAELLTSSAFRHPVTRLEVRETNISWVILTGLYAYKIKKNVQLGFIDQSTLAKRRRLCEEELRLNQRLAADLYVDVVTITRDVGGTRIGGDGAIIEYSVRMKQFVASDELSALLEASAVGAREIAELAQLVAVFHARAARAEPTGDCLHTAQLHDAVLGNLAMLVAHLDLETAVPEMGTFIDWTHDFLHDSLPELHLREQSGFIRECHGDLHARNVVRWHGRLVPFDCLEFDPKLRWIDAMNDVAFLVMDLEGHNRKDLAFTFLNSYLEHTGDYDGVRLLPFYAVYHALVRAMVDALGAERDPNRREEFRKRLRTRIKTAASFISHPAPALCIMHGPSGSGKSWLSGRLATQLGAIRLRSDVERKRLGGVTSSYGPEVGFERGIYTPELSHHTYARLLDCAESCLTGGINAIVDAAFLDCADRRLFHELATAHGISYVIVACEAERLVLMRRIEMRRNLGIDPSDADVTVLDRQLRDTDPLSADERLHAVTVDTSMEQADEQALAAIRQRIASGINDRLPA